MLRVKRAIFKRNLTLTRIVLKIYPCFLHSHKLPNEITTNYRIRKINLFVSKKNSTFAAEN